MVGNIEVPEVEYSCKLSTMASGYLRISCFKAHNLFVLLFSKKFSWNAIGLFSFHLYKNLAVLINLEPNGYVLHLCKQWKNCVTQLINNPTEMDVDTDVNPDVNMDINPDVNTDEMSGNSSPPR